MMVAVCKLEEEASERTLPRKYLSLGHPTSRAVRNTFLLYQVGSGKLAQWGTSACSPSVKIRVQIPSTHVERRAQA